MLILMGDGGLVVGWHLSFDGCYITWEIMLASSSSELDIFVTTIIIFHQVQWLLALKILLVGLSFYTFSLQAGFLSFQGIGSLLACSYMLHSGLQPFTMLPNKFILFDIYCLLESKLLYFTGPLFIGKCIRILGDCSVDIFLCLFKQWSLASILLVMDSWIHTYMLYE